MKIKYIKQIPQEIKCKIFYFLRDNNASILIDAFWKNKLSLTHIYVPRLSRKIWDELRPSRLESNVYGDGMYILRKKILVTERMLLLT